MLKPVCWVTIWRGDEGWRFFALLIYQALGLTLGLDSRTYARNAVPFANLWSDTLAIGLDEQTMCKLAEASVRTARSIVRRVIRAFDDYTKDVKVLRRARRDLLKAL